jgi:ribosomal protein S1
MHTEMTRITGTVKSVTAKAILLECDGVEGWIPLSLIEDGPGSYSEGEDVDVVIPEWKAEEYWG